MQIKFKRNLIRLASVFLINVLVLTACATKDGEYLENISNQEIQVETDWRDRQLNVPDDKYRTFYEIFVYSFYDSNGDGIGDLKGVIEKLDYLNDGDDSTDGDLGVNGIWLMPVMPSTTYHKYDTKDYMEIDPEYGTMEDFKLLLDECHKRGINVIIDLAMNHSSSKNQWFMEATSYLRNLPKDKEPYADECPYIEYYNFSKDAKGGYSQLAGTDWYYEAQFWSEMPDLNLKNEAVRAEFEEIARFWLDMGVDGFRLDAVKEFESGSVSTNVEILTWFENYVKSIAPDAYIVCECWMNSSEYAQYYASGVDSMFDFAFADKDGIIANVLNGKQDAASYGRTQVENNELYASKNAGFIDAPFYTNHDMGRSAGYYAGDNSLEKTKMGHALNLLMSGNAFIYYGEELGMKGSGIDENKRAPMYWSKDSETEGMCDGPKDMKKFEMKYESFEEQLMDENSIYNYVKDVIRLRNQNPEIARGEVTFYEEVSDDAICVISKRYENKEILLIFNTSAENREVNLEEIQINGKSVDEQMMLGELVTGQEQIILNGNLAIMPAYSVVIIGME